MNKSERSMKIGQYFVDKEIISQDQLNEALSLQKDNKGVVIGEVLVTIGAMTKEDLIMAMEMYIMETNAEPSHVDEWLDQDEIDYLLDKIDKYPQV